MGAPVVYQTPGAEQVPTRVRPSLEPAFNALRGAMEDGDDEYALGILDGLRVRARGDEELLKVLDSSERILKGRRLVRALNLNLRVEPAGIGKVGEVPARRFRLLLDVAHGRTDTLVLSLPPGTLERLTVSIDALGSQSKSYQTEALDLFEGLAIEPGRTETVELLTYNVPYGGQVAVRDQWDLQLLSGEVRRGDEAYPAMRVGVQRCERVSIAPYFPQEPLEPSVLLEYIAGEEIHGPPLIERTVRIDDARREEALELLAPLVEDLERDDPERLAEIAPALRWLARVVEPGTEWGDVLSKPARRPATRSPLDIGQRPTSSQPPTEKLDLP